MNTSKNQKSKSSNSHTSKSFFNKSGEGSFFSESKETNKPFFSAYPIQAKLTAGEISENGKGKTKNKSGMPDSLKVGLEQLSGIDLSGVRVHKNSSKPAQLNALAYTQGQDIHLGPGQEKHLPHEGWHVVQQMQGRVKPTIQVKNVSINDDAGLEQEADVMGVKASQMKGAKNLTIGSARREMLVLQREKNHEDHGGRQGIKVNALIGMWFRNVDIIKDKVDHAVKGKKTASQKSFSEALISIGFAPFSQLVVVGPLLKWAGTNLYRGLIADTLKEGVESGLNLAAEAMRKNGSEKIDVTGFTTKWKEGQVIAMNKISVKLIDFLDKGKFAPADLESLFSNIPKDLFSIDLGTRAILGKALSAINKGDYSGKKRFSYDTKYLNGVLKIFLNVKGLKKGGKKPTIGTAMIAGLDTEKLTALNDSIRKAGGLDPITMGIKTQLIVFTESKHPWKYSLASLVSMRNSPYTHPSYFYFRENGEPDTTSGYYPEAFKYFRSWGEVIPILAGFGINQPIISWRPWRP